MKKITKGLIVYFFINTLAANNLKIPENTVLCSACHGSNGISSNPKWPNLAGQNTRYFIKQLIDYQQGTKRTSALMHAVVEKLSSKDFNQLAEFYAKQPSPQGFSEKKYARRGEQLYRSGDLELSITACIACHGPQGQGNQEAGFPLLAGQHEYYTVNELTAFKEKTRTNDINSIMQDIASHLSKEDMQAVASYIQGLY